MSDLDSYAFEPGQKVQCRTRFDDVYKGEVVAFDLSSKILILKSPSSSGIASNHDLHFLVLDSVSDVQILEEPKSECLNDQLPNIEMKQITAKQSAALAERYSLVQAVGNGVSQEGLQLYTMLCKTYDRSNITWKDNVKIVVLNSVAIEPPYKEANCQPLSSKTEKEAVSYVKSNVQKFWTSQAKQQETKDSSTLPTSVSSSKQASIATTATSAASSSKPVVTGAPSAPTSTVAAASAT